MLADTALQFNPLNNLFPNVTWFCVSLYLPTELENFLNVYKEFYSAPFCGEH